MNTQHAQGFAQQPQAQQPQQVFAQLVQPPQPGVGQWVYVQQPQQAQQALWGYAQQPQQGFVPSGFAQVPAGFTQQGMPQPGHAQLQPLQDFGRQFVPFASGYDIYQRPDVPHARRGPKNYARSDERIRELICERLIENLSIDVSDVSIEVQNGRVTLNGTVPDRYMKHAIEDVVDGCWGVQDIENNMRVQSGQELGASPRNFSQQSRPIGQSGGGFSTSSAAASSGKAEKAGKVVASES